MDTIIFCWIAPVCAIISGFLLAFFQKRQKSFGCWYTQNLRIIFKAGITLVFLTALIFGYLGSMKGFESDDSSFWLGICGIAAMILLFYIGFSTGYHRLIFKINKEPHIDFKYFNHICNALVFVIFIAVLILWNIKIGPIIPAVFLIAALVSVIISLALGATVLFFCAITALICWGTKELVQLYWKWLKA